MTVHTTGQAPARSRRRTHVPEPYDFRRPMTMAREHARVLEMAFETFARQWGNQLTARLRAMAQVTLDGLSLQTYDEYVRGLPGTTAMMLCSVEQTRQTAVVQVPVSATMVWIDYMLGGPGTGDAREDRELTEIELTLLRGVMGAALGDLGYAFSSLTPLDVTLRSVQYNPQFVQAVPASDAVLVATFLMRVGEREDVASVMFPAEVLLAAVRQADGAGSRSVEDQRAHELAVLDLEAAVEDVPVEVAVRFAPVVVRPRDVVGLAVGDVVPLSHPSSQPLDVVVDGVVLARAAAGNNGSRLACMVVTVEEKH